MLEKIFGGLGDIFDNWLGLAGNDQYGTTPGVPKYKSLRAAIRLSKNRGPLDSPRPNDPPRPNAVEVIQRAMAMLEANIPQENWTPAESNWRWKKSLNLASHNPSQEKTLEKLTAFLLDDNWVNQVPVCNGLVEGGRASACRIDLVHHLADRDYELIELKFGTEGNCGSNHPLWAAMEIVHYGLMYLLFRRRRFRGGTNHHLLQAEQLKLIVLAPEGWYTYRPTTPANAQSSSFKFGWMATALTEGLQAYANANDLNLNIEMKFQALSPQFHANYLTLLGHIQAFRDDAFNSRQSISEAVGQ